MRLANIAEQLRGSRGPKGADGLECDIEFDAPGIRLLQEGEPIVGHMHSWVPGNIDRNILYCTCKAVGGREMTMDTRVNERKDLTELEAKQRELIAETNGFFAEVGHCGEDGLACGVCDECEEEIG